ncbi:MAG: creatininase family protein [Caldilineaceae bacterium]|nr:creatininase family protein [Caldilineaceae bacterium]MCB0144166.1 creatininase family protein [Caldilineaceae bacterium]
MTILLEEMTRDQIADLAPTALAVLPTASIEQHGPHMPVVTDTLLCGTVAQRAAEKAASQTSVVVTPVLWCGNSHHHRPFAGVLSLASPNYMAAVTDVLEGLMLSGFRKLLVLNGHGGNTDSNAVVGLDFANRLGHPVSIATAAYWDVARPALVETGIMPGNMIPGHAGRFETSMVMGLRPDLVNSAGLEKTRTARSGGGIFAPLVGATVQTHGAWAAGPGFTDEPFAASAEEGKRLMEIVVEQVANLMVTFGQS